MRFPLDLQSSDYTSDIVASRDTIRGLLMTDQHMHDRTNCLVCLRVPKWQWGFFYAEGDFCPGHMHCRVYYADMLLSEALYLIEYHDGREAEELVAREAEMRPGADEYFSEKEFDFFDWMYHPKRPVRFQEEVNAFYCE